MATFDVDFQSLDRQTTKGRAILALRDCVDGLIAGGGDDLGNHTATQALDMAGFNVDNVVLINGQNSANGVDSPNLVIQGGSPAGASGADGAEVQIIGGTSQDIGQAGDIIIRGGTSDRTPGGAVLINAGFTGAAATSATGGIVSISSSAGGSTGPSGTVNIATANGNGSSEAGKISLRSGTGGLTGGNGGLIELDAGQAGGVNGIGGAISILSGGSFFSGAGTSGDITFQIGYVPNIGNAGTLDILGADGGTGGIGTTINITAGGSNASVGGAVNVTTGSGLAGNVPGGDMTFTTGAAFGTTQHGGDVFFLCGAGIGIGEGGDFNARAGSGGATANGGFAEVRGGDGGVTSGDGGDVILRPGDENTGKRGLVRTFRGSFGEGVVNNGTISPGGGTFTVEPHITGWTRFVWGAAATGTVDIGTLRSGATENGVAHTIQLTNGGQGTLTWGTMVQWAGGSAPTLTAAGKDLLRFYTIDEGTTWMGEVIGLDFS